MTGTNRWLAACFSACSLATRATSRALLMDDADLLWSQITHTTEAAAAAHRQTSSQLSALRARSWRRFSNSLCAVQRAQTARHLELFAPKMDLPPPPPPSVLANNEIFLLIIIIMIIIIIGGEHTQCYLSVKMFVSVCACYLYAHTHTHSQQQQQVVTRALNFTALFACRHLSLSLYNFNSAGQHTPHTQKILRSN